MECRSSLTEEQGNVNRKRYHLLLKETRTFHGTQFRSNGVSGMVNKLKVKRLETEVSERCFFYHGVLVCDGSERKK